MRVRLLDYNQGEFDQIRRSKYHGLMSHNYSHFLAAAGRVTWRFLRASLDLLLQGISFLLFQAKHKLLERKQKGLHPGFIVVFIALLFYSFSLLYSNRIPQEQKDYQEWLKKLIAQIKSDETNNLLPSISLKVVGQPHPALPKEISLHPRSDFDSRNQIIRILQLIDESQLFALHQSKQTQPSDGDCVLLISHSAQNFQIIFPSEKIQHNIKATLLLKLLSEYSKTATPQSELLQVLNDAATVVQNSLGIESASSNTKKEPYELR